MIDLGHVICYQTGGRHLLNIEIKGVLQVVRSVPASCKKVLYEALSISLKSECDILLLYLLFKLMLSIPGPIINSQRSRFSIL